MVLPAEEKPPSSYPASSPGSSTALAKDGSSAVGARRQGARIMPTDSAESERLPGTDAAAQPQLEGNQLWFAVRRRWLACLTVGLLLGGMAAAVAFFVRPAKYTAFALVKIDAERPELLPRDHPVVDLEMFRTTQIALMKSPKVLEAALQDEKVRGTSVIAEQADPVGWLESALVVEPVTNTELLRVSLNTMDAQEGAILVNAVTQAYIHEVQVRDQSQRLARLKDLQEVCEKSQNKLREDRERLRKEVGNLDVHNPQTAAMRQKNALETYSVLRKEMIPLQAELLMLQKMREVGGPDAAPEDPAVTDTAVELALDEQPDVMLQAKHLAQVEETLVKIRSTARDGFRGIQTAEEDVKSAKAALIALRTQLQPSVKAKVLARAEPEKLLTRKRFAERGQLLKVQLAGLQKEADEYQKILGLPADALETAGIKAALEFQHLVEMEKVRLESNPAMLQRSSIELPATPGRFRNRKQQMIMAGGAGLVGFLGGALAIAFWDYRAKRIYSQKEVVQGLGLRVLGSLPIMMPQPRLDHAGKLRKYVRWGHQWNEALSGIRTLLLHEAGQNELQVVQVTSAEAQEGKTTLATHLARSLVCAGRRTLLIDADLRRPALHVVFDMPPAPGLSEVLCGKVMVETAIRPTALPGLDLLPAGVLDDMVLQSLAQGRLEATLHELRSRYDTIVIDSSPIMVANDTLLIGHHVDAVLLSIRPSQSRVPVVQEACERLRSLDIPVLGTVLNGLLSSHRDLLDRYVASAARPVAMLPDTASRQT
jgi:polysaccharide biosynthesis transport protein